MWYKCIFASAQSTRVYFIKPGDGLAEFLIYETHTRFIKTLKDFNTLYQDIKSGQAFLNQIPAIFHPPHPAHLLKNTKMWTDKHYGCFRPDF